MNRGAARLLAAGVAAALVALLLPSAACAFQDVTLENTPDLGGKTLHIVGDRTKETDKVTIAYDSVNDEYVIGHDIREPAPPGCRFEGAGPPYTVLRCPAKGITVIVIETGADRDPIDLDPLIADYGIPDLTVPTYIPLDLRAVVINCGPGADSLQESTTLVKRVQPQAAPAVGNPVVQNIDMGQGTDTAAISGGSNTVAFADNGKLTGGNGPNTVSFGDGNSQATLGDGPNKVSFGAGNDSAGMGAGDDRFDGGPGNDKARLGAGDDHGIGGLGKDRLFGGRGDDHLLGYGGFDLLNGGGGSGDRCPADGGGAKLVGCE